MPETDPAVAENCTGTFEEFTPLEAFPDDANFIRCNGCGEVSMIRNNQRTILIPGAS